MSIESKKNWNLLDLSQFENNFEYEFVLNNK